MNQESEREYLGREFSEFGTRDVYIENGLYYYIPIMSLTEMHRLLDLSDKLEKDKKEK